MDSGKDYLKYLTERIVRYVDTPRNERKMARTTSKETWQYRWFGMLPVSFRVWADRFDRKRKVTHHGGHDDLTSD